MKGRTDSSMQGLVEEEEEDEKRENTKRRKQENRRQLRLQISPGVPVAC